MRTLIKATSESFKLGEFDYKNDLINLNNTTAITKEVFNIGTDKEHYVINFLFNNQDNHYWRFSTESERNTNYDLIVLNCTIWD